MTQHPGPGPQRGQVALGSAILLVLFGATGPALGQSSSERIDLAVVGRIRAEALEHSRAMELVGYLTDVVGPRLTGSPNLRKAQAYAREMLRSWGVANAHLEPWGPFGRGWALDAVTVNMTAPGFSPLIGYPKAWSGSTPGTITGEPVFLDAKTPADLGKYRGTLKGRIVLFSSARVLTPLSSPQAHRMSDADLAQLASAPPPPARGSIFHPTPEQRASSEFTYAKWQLVYSEGAAVVLEPSFNSGSVYVTSAVLPVSPDAPAAARPHPWDANKPTVIPQVVLIAEHYNRLIRLIERGVPVSLDVRVAAHYYDDDPMSANLIGEIPGTDLKDEVVMFGGCLDSWHAGTGATDNGVGAAAALEAVRILQTLGLHPRRSIRIALWSAEEQGTLGSQAYVAAHFGQLVTQADGHAQVVRGPEYDALAGYFNLDWGPGRLRGVYLQGNEAVRPIFRTWLAPFEDLGASTLTPAGIGATDHISFDQIGLPGFQFIRDFMEGGGGPGHTNLDVFDHVVADDLRQTAAIVASFAYNLAMRDEKLPRKH